MLAALLAVGALRAAPATAATAAAIAATAATAATAAATAAREISQGERPPLPGRELAQISGRRRDGRAARVAA